MRSSVAGSRVFVERHSVLFVPLRYVPRAECWSSIRARAPNAQVSRAMYIPYPKIDEDNGVDISERCYNAVVYTAAGLTLLTCGETEKGNSVSELAQTFLK
jgi:hypothetical protein